MHDAEQLIGPVGPAPRFATAFRGYDRSQVDSWLRDHEREMAEVAGPLADTTRQQQALESRLADLQLEEPDAALAPAVPSPESLAAFVVRRAHDIARELPDHMVHQAETERQLAEATAAEMIDEARARSAEIIEAAQRDRERVGGMIDEAHRQLDFFREQANDAARERVQQTWRETSAALAEVEVELAALRAERHAMVSELSELDEALEASRAQLRRRDAIEVDVVAPTDTRVDRFERQPERPRWALMPVEW